MLEGIRMILPILGRLQGLTDFALSAADSLVTERSPRPVTLPSENDISAIAESIPADSILQL
jgi:hypothetical protein